jgi:SAM-dependent methyltransferase
MFSPFTGTQTMQDDTGLKAILKVATLYSWYQRAVGADYAWKWLVREHLRARAGDKIIDIGCGPGDVLELLPKPQYIGIDISEAYVRQGQQRHGNSALFLHGTTEDYRGDSRLRDADIVMCFGVLHHVNDTEARQILSFARENLKPGGRFVGAEPSYLVHQSRASMWIMSKDRGQNVRPESEWKGLLSAEFPQHSTSVITGLIRVPYTHILLEGRKEAGDPIAG